LTTRLAEVEGQLREAVEHVRLLLSTRPLHEHKNTCPTKGRRCWTCEQIESAGTFLKPHQPQEDSSG
ncbi:hypothetical protein LCGC14_1932540, partial [marine sediment metagenome]